MQARPGLRETSSGCPVSDAAALAAAVEAAKTTPEIIEAVVRAVWHNEHNGSEAPAEVLRTLDEATLCAALNAGKTVHPDKPAPLSWFSDLTEALREAGEATAALRDDAVAGWWEGTMIAGRYYLTGVLQMHLVSLVPEQTTPPAPVSERETALDSDALIDEGTSMEVRRMQLPEVHQAWRAVLESDRPRYPLAPVVAELVRNLPAKACTPKRRAAMPKLQNATNASELPLMHPERQLLLPFKSNHDVIDRCPAPLLELFSQATSAGGFGGNRGLAWSFMIMLGGLVSLPGDRRGYSRPVLLEGLTVDDVIGWRYPVRWSDRARDCAGCSPPARGWPVGGLRRQQPAGVFPARAGMARERSEG
ncbi:MAG: hypothetical protein OXC08_11980 [Thiotrichales bacterium]|nr:hypothetical protein [Thiotrichales bacterium]